MLKRKKFLIVAWFTFSLIFVSGCAMRAREGGFNPDEIFGEGGHSGDSYIQNEYLRLDFLAETLEIVLTDRATGDVWRSTPEGVGEHPEAVTTAIERFHAQSLLVLHYESRIGVGRPLDTYRFSMRTGRFEHEVIGDMLEVRMTIGDIVEQFYVPDAIYEERLYAFLEGVSRMDRMRVTSEFTPASQANPLPGMSSADFLERFPTAAYGHTIYVLNDDIPSFRLQFAEDTLREAGYTYEDWVEDMVHFNVPTVINQAAFNVIMRFELDRNSMVVTIPFDEITYVNDFMPTQLVVMPYFGAAVAADGGYLFVPDGSGAIMYFDSARHTSGLYFNRIFGHDEAIVREHVLHDNRGAYPVFGIYRNESTLVAIIEEGAAYASVRAEVAGMRAPFSRVHSLFRLLHGTPLDVQGRSNDLIFMHEWELPPGESIVIRYVIAEGDGYVGMAHAYRDFLQERYPWLNERVQEPVHAVVEILGAALTPQHILGFPIDRPYPLTSYEQAADMMETLHGFGWRDLHVKMRGAHNDSIDHIVPTSLDLISQMGGRRGFENMVNTADNLGFTFYLEGDFMFMRGDTWFDGFRPMRDAARQANRERVSHAGFSTIYFGPIGTGSVVADPVIVASPGFMMNTAQNFVEEAAGRGVNNIAFRCMASALAGDFNEDRHITREYSMNMRVDFLSGLRDDGTGLWLNYGFSYAAPFADIITGMPLTDQGFGITDIAVPFYQIALHGLVPFAGRQLNLAEDNSYHRLKSIESGALPFFSFMYVPTADLLVSRYRRYFANEFGRWSAEANRVYWEQVENFGHLYNQLITDHQVLHRDGVTVTVWEDGTRVYVNTTISDFVTEGGLRIPARPAQSWVVVR